MRSKHPHAGRFALGILAAALTALLWGCGSEPRETPRTEKPLVGVLVYRQHDAYIERVTGFIRDALADKVTVKVLYAGGDQLTQSEQLATLISEKASAIALNIVDPLAAGKAVDTIKKAGIPVVFFNREPDLDSIKNYGNARFVGTTPADAGVMQGDIIKDLWTRHPEFDRNRDGKFQYIMIQANLDNPEALARTQYSVKRARESGVPMQQVGETLLCGWDKDQAREAMLLMFPAYRDTVEIVISNNDSMALGAISAMNESGYNLPGGDRSRFIPVIGVDALPEAIEAIRQGIMSATVIQNAEGMGNAVAAMLLNALNGKDFLEGLPHTWDASGVAIRIPYSRFSGDAE